MANKPDFYALLQPVVAGAGLFLEDATLRGAGRNQVLLITVDLADEHATGSVDSEKLTEVSYAISSALDDLKTDFGAYTLEVSTPGTDRPLTEARHFNRARGRLVNLTLQDGTKLLGRLLETGEELRVQLQDKAQTVRNIPLADVVRGKIEVELRKLDAKPTADGDN